jgi:transposase
MGRQRRKYDKQFKKESVEYLKKVGKTITEVSAELGIERDILSRWQKEYNEHQGKAFPGNGNPIEAELFQLRRKLADVEEERDILKKALAIFSKVKK